MHFISSSLRLNLISFPSKYAFFDTMLELVFSVFWHELLLSGNHLDMYPLEMWNEIRIIDNCDMSSNKYMFNG